MPPASHINPGPEWSIDKAYSRSRIRLCFASPTHEEIREGIACWPRSAARNSACPSAAPMSSGARRDTSELMNDFGILAIFNDCRAGREAEFEEWFQGEHLLERLAVPGFLYGRRHQAISGSCGYFNFYLVESPAVLTSKPYLERLDNPTPMTKKIMSEIFINMNRTVCRRTRAARRLPRRLCGDGALQRRAGRRRADARCSTHW